MIEDIWFTWSDDNILQHGPLEIDDLEDIGKRAESQPTLRVYIKYAWKEMHVGWYNNWKNKQIQTLEGRYRKQQSCSLSGWKSGTK